MQNSNEVTPHDDQMGYHIQYYISGEVLLRQIIRGFALPHANTLHRYVSFKDKSCGVLTDNIDILKSKLKESITDVSLVHDEI